MQRFFAPGRTELAGNHTDHQLGRVLAASVDVGITARATRRRDRRVWIPVSYTHLTLPTILRV